MKTYSPQELREIDAKVAEHIQGYRRTLNPDEHTTDAATLFWHRPPSSNHKESVLIGQAYTSRGLTEEYGKEMFSHSWTHYSPTTDPASSDALDDWILEQDCTEYIAGYGEGNFYFQTHSGGEFIDVEHPDKKICRALFALKLKGVEIKT